jgi:hypothetical protein
MINLTRIGHAGIGHEAYRPQFPELNIDLTDIATALCVQHLSTPRGVYKNHLD